MHVYINIQNILIFLKGCKTENVFEPSEDVFEFGKFLFVLHMVCSVKTPTTSLDLGCLI